METSLSWVRKNLRKRSESSRKGDNGSVLVVGGSVHYTGAPFFVGMGALRAGADLVYVLCPDSIASAVSSYSPDLIVRRFKGDFLNLEAGRELKKLSEHVGCIVVGNGLSTERNALSHASYLMDLVDEDVPIIVDGDALGSVFCERGVYTPHAGEFARLFGATPAVNLKHRAGDVLSLSKKLGNPVLLKGMVDVVSDGERVCFNKTGNAGMSVGGTGDVLSGVLAAFVAQGHSLFDSAALAAFVNGAAGDLAFKKFGFGMLASDTLPLVADVLKQARGQ